MPQTNPSYFMSVPVLFNLKSYSPYHFLLNSFFLLLISSLTTSFDIEDSKGFTLSNSFKKSEPVVEFKLYNSSSKSSHLISKDEFLNGVALYSNDRHSKEANKRRLACLSMIRNEYRSTLISLIKNQKIFLVDVGPLPNNLGDSFTRVGEYNLFDELNLEIIDYCNMKFCNLSKIYEKIQEYGNGFDVVVHGGGHLSDVLRLMWRHRPTIESIFQNHTIIFMPRTLHYSKSNFAMRHYGFMKLFPNLHLLARDKISYMYAKNRFQDINVTLCPDSSVNIDPIDLKSMSNSCQPIYDVMVLSSTIESSSAFHTDLHRMINAFDKNNISTIHTNWGSWRDLARNRPMSPDLKLKSYTRLKIGVEMFCLSQLIVTDHLQAVVLAILMGRPNVYFDTKHVKIRRFKDSIFAQNVNCQNNFVNSWPASSWREAVVLTGDYFGKDIDIFNPENLDLFQFQSS